MRLSELPAELNLQITRDGEFRNLGFLSDRQEAKLVFLESPHLLAGLSENQDVVCVVTNSQLAKEIRDATGSQRSTRNCLANLAQRRGQEPSVRIGTTERR